MICDCRVTETLQGLVTSDHFHYVMIMSYTRKTQKQQHSSVQEKVINIKSAPYFCNTASEAILHEHHLVQL